MKINEPDVSIKLTKKDAYQLQLLLDEKFQLEEIQNSGTGEINEYQDWLKATEGQIQHQSEDLNRQAVTLKPVDWEQIEYILENTADQERFTRLPNQNQNEYEAWLRTTADKIKQQLERAHV